MTIASVGHELRVALLVFSHTVLVPLVSHLIKTTADVVLQTSVSTGPGVTAVYVTSEAAADTTADFQYTAGERLRIAVPK